MSCQRAGFIDVIDLSAVFVQFVRNTSNEHEWQQDQAYLPKGTDGRATAAVLRQAQAFKACVRVLRHQVKASRPDGRDVADSPVAMLLARTGNVYGLKLSEFKERLVNALVETTGADRKVLSRLIVASTAHSAKGGQALTVIVLDTTARQFPKIHPDSLLFEIFGTTQKQVLDEERRLFYVAISRAVHRLVLLTEAEKESPYLSSLTQAKRLDAANDHLADAGVPTSTVGATAARIRRLLSDGPGPDASTETAPANESLQSPRVSSAVKPLELEPDFKLPF